MFNVGSMMQCQRLVRNLAGCLRNKPSLLSAAATRVDFSISAALRENAVPAIESQQKIKKDVTVDQITNANTAQDILGVKRVHNTRHIGLILEKLTKWSNGTVDNKQEEVRKVLEDKKFEEMTMVLHKKATDLEPFLLVSVLGRLLELQADDGFVIQSLEMQAQWLMTRMPVSQLIRLLEIHTGHQETDLRKKIYSQALMITEKRWVEISNGRDIIKLMYLFDGNAKFIGKLEEKAMDLCENMSAKELFRILVLMSKSKHRNTPLLRAIVYHLNRQRLSLNPGQLMNLLFACNTLQLYDQNLLEKICLDLQAHIPKVDNSKVMTSILHSLASLRWKNPEQLDAIVENLIARIDSVSSEELATVVISSARLSHCPIALRDSQDKVLGKLNGVKDNSRLWLDVVWSLCVLQLASPETVASVLDPEFSSKIEEKDTFRLLTRHLKTMNINAYSQLELSNYNGPLLSKEFICNNQLQSPRSSNLVTSVIESLKNIAPGDKYLRTALASPYGYSVDAEMIVNNSGQPQVLTSYSSVSDAQDVHNNRHVQADWHRIVFKVYDFQDLTLNSEGPIGHHSMAVRHLGLLGYKVIQISHTQFDSRATLVDRVKFLHDQIKMAVGVDVENQTMSAKHANKPPQQELSGNENQATTQPHRQTTTQPSHPATTQPSQEGVVKRGRVKGKPNLQVKIDMKDIFRA